MKFSAWMLVVFLFLGNIEVCQAVKIILLARFITRFCSNYCILGFCLFFTSRLVISNGQFMGSVAHILNKYWCSITALTQNLSSFSFFYYKILVQSLRKFSWLHYLLDDVYFSVNKVLLTNNIENLVQWTHTLNQMCIKYPWDL